MFIEKLKQVLRLESWIDLFARGMILGAKMNALGGGVEVRM